ncbi:hypothetical protein CRG98_014831 [Punica granatum]|uniref:Uncharacterized protein n=1 Tax=Punica granatum TaxID=22663 RepID=A0A2I0K8A0_PUNGR|nr:hypothetical protein CRG98_014831 [Punica granatum]
MWAIRYRKHRCTRCSSHPPISIWNGLRFSFLSKTNSSFQAISYHILMSNIAWPLLATDHLLFLLLVGDRPKSVKHDPEQLQEPRMSATSCQADPTPPSRPSLIAFSCLALPGLFWPLITSSSSSILRRTFPLGKDMIWSSSGVAELSALATGSSSPPGFTALKPLRISFLTSQRTIFANPSVIIFFI